MYIWGPPGFGNAFSHLHTKAVSFAFTIYVEQSQTHGPHLRANGTGVKGLFVIEKGAILIFRSPVVPFLRAMIWDIFLLISVYL